MFKASVATVTAAIVAGATAFGAAYAGANLDGVISGGEWVSVVVTTLTSVVAALFHDSKPAA